MRRQSPGLMAIFTARADGRDACALTVATAQTNQRKSTGISVRELDRDQSPTAAPIAHGTGPLDRRPGLAIIGAGRAGGAIAAGLGSAGWEVTGPLGRDANVPGACRVVLLCVPDSAIAEVAQTLPDDLAVGHVSGAHGSDLLRRKRAFAVHPLMTLVDRDSSLHGAWAAIDGADTEMLELAAMIASDLGMKPFTVASGDRARYHAAASVASNFLVTLEAAAEKLAASAGVPRAALVPLVSQTVANWERVGASEALTGPVARGDKATVERQREAVADSAPELMDLFDVLCEVTERVSKGEGAFSR